MARPLTHIQVMPGLFIHIDAAAGLLVLAALTFCLQPPLGRGAARARRYTAAGAMQGMAQQRLKTGDGVRAVVILAARQGRDDVQNALAVNLAAQA